MKWLRKLKQFVLPCKIYVDQTISYLICWLVNLLSQFRERELDNIKPGWQGFHSWSSHICLGYSLQNGVHGKEMSGHIYLLSQDITIYLIKTPNIIIKCWIIA